MSDDLTKIEIYAPLEANQIKGRLFRLCTPDELDVKSYEYSCHGYSITIEKMEGSVPLLMRSAIDWIGNGSFYAKLRIDIYNADIFDDDLFSTVAIIELQIEIARSYLDKITSKLPAIILKAAIQLLMDGHPQSYQKELLILINSEALNQSLIKIANLDFKAGYVNSSGAYFSISTILFLITGYRYNAKSIESLKTKDSKEKQRAKEFKATAKLLQTLNQGSSDSPVDELSLHIKNSSKVSNNRKVALDIYKHSIDQAKKADHSLIYSGAPLLSEILLGFMWALENKGLEDSISTYSGLNYQDSIKLEMFDAKTRRKRFERRLLKCFDDFYGRYPNDCEPLLAFALEKDLEGEQLNFKNIKDDFSRWKNNSDIF